MLNNTNSSALLSVVKRDGTVVPFDESKVIEAIFKAAKAVGGKDDKLAKHVAYHVHAILSQRHATRSMPNVEEIQDLVEKTLIELGLLNSKSLYSYREQKRKIRESKFYYDSLEI